MTWEALAALLACLVVPGVWGWLVFRLSRRWLRAKSPPAQTTRPPPDAESPWDYQI